MDVEKIFYLAQRNVWSWITNKNLRTNSPTRNSVYVHYSALKPCSKYQFVLLNTVSIQKRN